MDIKTTIKTGLVNVGLFRCATGHSKIAEATPIMAEDGSVTGYNDIVCTAEGCSLMMSCKATNACEFSYDET